MSVLTGMDKIYNSPLGGELNGSKGTEESRIQEGRKGRGTLSHLSIWRIPEEKVMCDEKHVITSHLWGETSLKFLFCNY
jgi:hypothetical protein